MNDQSNPFHLSEQSHESEWDIGELLHDIRGVLIKTLQSDSASMMNVMNASNGIKVKLHKLETYLYSIRSIPDCPPCQFLMELAIAFCHLFHRIQCSLHNASSPHFFPSNAMGPRPPPYYANHIEHRGHISTTTSLNAMDIEIALCDSILVCSVEMFLIVLEHCTDHKLIGKALHSLEKLLAVPSDMIPQQWFAANAQFFESKYRTLHYFGFDAREPIAEDCGECPRIIKQERSGSACPQMAMNVDNDTATTLARGASPNGSAALIDVPSFDTVVLKKALKVTDIEDHQTVLGESSMNRISEISRLDNRHLFRYTGTKPKGRNQQHFINNDAVALIMEWIFDVFDHSSHGMERSLCVCLDTVDVLLKEDAQKGLCTVDGRERILLLLSNADSIMELLHCLLSIPSNNRKVFNSESLSVPIFVSFVGTILNGILRLHRTLNDAMTSIVMKTGNPTPNAAVTGHFTAAISIEFLIHTVSSHVHQMVDFAGKLMQCAFLKEQTALRRHIVLQCKAVYYRQILYLMNRAPSIMDAQCLKLFAGDPKLVEPLLINLSNINGHNSRKSDAQEKPSDSHSEQIPSQLVMQRDVLCSILAANFCSLSQLRATTTEILNLPSLDDAERKLFVVNGAQKCCGRTLQRSLMVIEGESLAMNRVESQAKLLQFGLLFC